MFRLHKPALVLTFFLFALWGVGHRLHDTLVPEFARVFALNSSELVLTQSVYSLIYLVLAIPAAIYARTFGSKAAIVFGLGAWCVGAFLFYPAAQQHAFLFFLFAAAVMSSGYLFLEIGANPLVAGMGPPKTATLRLNCAHALYPVGVLVAVYVGRWVILSNNTMPFDKLADAVVRPYMVLGVIVLGLAFVVDHLTFPSLTTERGNRRTAIAEFNILLHQPRFLAAMGAQACNVAAMAGTWTLSAWYIKEAMPGAAAPVAADFLLASLIVFAVGRIVGAVLMVWFDPLKLLALFAASGLILGAVASVEGGQLGVYAVVASSFSVSIMFATILGAAISDLGPKTKAGTALIYMGGSGSAIGVAAMHLVWSVSSIHLAMLVPTLGYAGVLLFALTQKRMALPITAAPKP